MPNDASPTIVSLEQEYLPRKACSYKKYFFEYFSYTGKILFIRDHYKGWLPFLFSDNCGKPKWLQEDH